MPNPKPLVQTGSAAPASNFKPKPVYVDGVGGDGAVSWNDITGKPATFAPTIGTTATTAKAGNYTPPNASTSVKGLVNQAATQTNTAATDVAGLVTDFNALLDKLKAAGIMA